MKRLPQIILFAIIMASVFSCKKSKNTTPTDTNVLQYSQPIPFGLGYARSFTETDVNGHLLKIGIQLTATAMSTLPDSIIGNNGTAEVPMPAADSVSGINHLRVQWHPSQYDSLYIAHDTAYVEAYFFLASNDELKNIKTGPDSTIVDSLYIPKDYHSTYFALAKTGVSWNDSTAVQERDSTFRLAFDYGFYQGKMVFMKAAINNNFLQSDIDTTMDIKQPSAFQQQAYYPTRLHIYYAESQQLYIISLEGLQEH